MARLLSPAQHEELEHQSQSTGSKPLILSLTASSLNPMVNSLSARDICMQTTGECSARSVYHRVVESFLNKFFPSGYPCRLAGIGSENLATVYSQLSSFIANMAYGKKRRSSSSFIVKYVCFGVLFFASLMRDILDALDFVRCNTFLGLHYLCYPLRQRKYATGEDALKGWLVAVYASSMKKSSHEFSA